jgi:hypothetical protein
MTAGVSRTISSLSFLDEVESRADGIKPGDGNWKPTLNIDLAENSLGRHLLGLGCASVKTKIGLDLGEMP